MPYNFLLIRPPVSIVEQQKMISIQSARWTLCLLMACSFLCSAEQASAWAEKQIGEVEIVNTKLGRYRRLAINVSDTAQRGYMQYMTAPPGYSFVVIWMDLKITPGKDSDGDPRTYIPDHLISFDGGSGKKLKALGRCTPDGRMESGYYSSSYSYYGTPEKETIPHSMVVAVPDNVAEFKFTFGNEKKDIQAPSLAEDTLDRAACAIFKVAKVEVVDKLEDEQRVGDYDDPLGTSPIEVEAPAGRFAIVTLYIKGKASNQSEGGFSFTSNDLGALYAGVAHSGPLGYISDDEFQTGYTYINSGQDVVGDFFTASVRLVFPLPGKLKEFQLLYLMQPIADIKVD